MVVGDVTGDDVIARAADDVLDQRGRVVVVEQRIRDVAGRVMTTAEICELCRRNRGPAARLKIDRERRGVVGEIVGVLSAAVPDRHEDLVAGRRALPTPLSDISPVVGLHL